MEFGTFLFHVSDICIRERRKPEEVCVRLHDIGYRFMEMDYRQATEETLCLLRESGFQISSLFGIMDFSEYPEERIQSLLAAADRAKPRFVMPIPAKDDTPELFRKTIPVLRELTRRLADRGIITILEDFDGPGKSFASSRGVLRYLEEVPDLKCCFDTGNFLYTGEELLSVWPLLAEKTVHVHFKDRRKDEKYGQYVCTMEDGTPVSGCAVGDGILPLREFAALLKQSGYSGIAMEEHAGCFHQLTASERSFCNFQQWFGEKKCLKC